MWCWGVKVPRLRAMIATVRNLAQPRSPHWGGGACLLRSLSSPFRTLQIMLGAGYGDLHCFPGTARSLRIPEYRQSERSSSWEGLLRLLTLLAPSFLRMPAEESSRLTSESGKVAGGLRCRTESQTPTEVNSQPLSCHSSWSADQALKSFPGSNLAYQQPNPCSREAWADAWAKHLCWLHAALPEARPPCLNAGSPLGDGSNPRRHTARCAASTLWTTGRDALLARGASQEAARQAAPQGPVLSIHSGCQLLPGPPVGGPGSSSRPLPTHFQAKAWVIESVPTQFAAAWRAGRFL